MEEKTIAHVESEELLYVVKRMSEMLTIMSKKIMDEENAKIRGIKLTEEGKRQAFKRLDENVIFLTERNELLKRLTDATLGTTKVKI